MLISKTAKVKWHNSNKKYFEQLGYKYTKMGDEFEVKVEHLTKGSKAIIKCKCDYCNTIFSIQYKRYTSSKLCSKSGNKKDCCSNRQCKGKKIKESSLLLYNVDNYAKTKEFKEKIKKTCLNKYGVEYAIQNDEVKNKSKETCLKKYGVTNAGQCPEIIKKRLKTMFNNNTSPCSKQQKHIFDLLYNIDNNYKLNYPIDKCSLDIANIQNKIYIEYDGEGHDLQVKLGHLSKKEFNNKEIKREKFLKQKNWKIIRIISNNDKLPKDDILLSLINECTNYLKYTNYT